MSARLVIDADDETALETLLAGVADIQIVEVDAGVSGELLRTRLRLLGVVPINQLAAADPQAACKGPPLRLFTIPAPEES